MTLTTTFSKPKNSGGIEHKKKFVIFSIAAYVFTFDNLLPILKFTFGFMLVFAVINGLKLSPIVFLSNLKRDTNPDSSKDTKTGRVVKKDQLGRYGFPTNYRVKLDISDNWFYSDKTLFSSLKVGEEITFTYTPKLKIIHEYSK